MHTFHHTLKIGKSDAHTITGLYKCTSVWVSNILNIMRICARVLLISIQKLREQRWTLRTVQLIYPIEECTMEAERKH